MIPHSPRPVALENRFDIFIVGAGAWSFSFQASEQLFQSEVGGMAMVPPPSLGFMKDYCFPPLNPCCQCGAETPLPTRLGPGLSPDQSHYGALLATATGLDIGY